MRDFMLVRYQRRLWLDARRYLQVTHGKDWSHSRHMRVLEDLTAIHDILWHAASNNWFEYLLGSRLIFVPFPARYRSEAKRGVKVFFTSKGLSSRRRQPHEEKAPQVRQQGLPGSTCWLNRVFNQVFCRPKRSHRWGCPRLENSFRRWRKQTQRLCLGSLLLLTNCKFAFANNRRRNSDERPGSRKNVFALPSAPEYCEVHGCRSGTTGVWLRGLCTALDVLDTKLDGFQIVPL
jgi:hypothetical protein